MVAGQEAGYLDLLLFYCITQVPPSEHTPVSGPAVVRARLTTQTSWLQLC